MNEAVSPSPHADNANQYDVLPSLATRRWSPTARTTGRSSIPAIIAGSPHVRIIDHESLFESNISVVLLARRDIINLVEQPQAVGYYDFANLRWASHTFDFLVTMADGTTIAIAARPKNRAAKVQRAVDAIIAQGCDFADRYMVVTDADLPEAMVKNAALILAVRRDRDRSADDKVRAIVATLHGATTIEALVNASGLEGKAFRAVARLIDQGELEIDRDTLIDFEALVRPSNRRAAA